MLSSRRDNQAHNAHIIHQLPGLVMPLFRKKRFEINFFVQRNALKVAIFIEKENPGSFFRFSFRATLSFPL